MNWKEEALVWRCKQLMDALDRMEFIGRAQVHTYLKFDGRRVQGSETTVRFFQKRSTHGYTANWKFYISVDVWTPTDKHRLYRDIARILNCNVEIRILDETLLVSVLECPIYGIQQLLDSNYIMDSVERSFVPALGSYVSQEYGHLLILGNFIFYPGQLVALEIDDPFDKGELGEPVFILVEILERHDAGNPEIPTPMTKYKIGVSYVEERIVAAMSLYAFIRYNAHTCNDQRQATYNRQEGATSIPHPTPSEPPKAKTLIEAVEEIKKILKEARKGTPEEWNKIRRRLYLIWHPDKNPGQVDLCTEVCKILQKLIRLLKEGRSIDDYNISNRRPSSSRSTNDYGSDFDEFYHWAGERSRYYNQRRDRSSRRSSGRHSGGFYSSRQEYENFFTGFRNSQNPQPGEARRWMRKARHAFDWMCLKWREVLFVALVSVPVIIYFLS